MSDEFAGFQPSLTSPGEDGFEIIPNNDADLSRVTRGVNVHTSGIVRFTLSRQEDGQFIDLFVAAGIAFPIRAKRIWASGTTATNITGLL